MCLGWHLILLILLVSEPPETGSEMRTNRMSLSRDANHSPSGVQQSGHKLPCTTGQSSCSLMPR